MQKLFISLTAMVTAALAVGCQPTLAQVAMHGSGGATATVGADEDDDGADKRGKVVVIGGGQGSFGADLDNDGDVDGSYFGIGVVIQRGSVQGHFVCAMWGNTDFLGLPLMGVEGQVNSASINKKAKSVTIKGIGTVDLGTGAPGFFSPVPFEVTLTQGGVGTGTLILTVIGAFDGVPGDTNVGNGNYDLPAETVTSGLIVFR